MNGQLSSEDEDESRRFKKWIRTQQKNGKNARKVNQFISVWDKALFEMKNADLLVLESQILTRSPSKIAFKELRSWLFLLTAQDSITESSNSTEVIQVRLKDEAVIKYLSEGIYTSWKSP